MTFSEFKERFTAIFWRDTQHSNERIYRAMLMCADEILSKKDVPSHIEIDDESAKVFRRIDDKYFIRPFAAPQGESGKIDFDDNMLIEALVYLTASRLSVDNAAFFESRYFVAINNYENKIWDEGTKSIDDMLEKTGYKRPYTLTKGILAQKYNWDKGFITSLDEYLSDYKKTWGLSYEHFIRLFVDFQNGKNQRADMIALDKKMSEKSLGFKEK
ncbi:hypothetical protein [Campylobacter sp.]|uniref:hypothetical protein n=1 Tax=Campylobacter sp. TaxID=205 RepID=UPI002A81032C|nr:hypothetical protein [Campylobacter sp.]MDY4446227.1 hypothetical protein [Campylobacter sp.]